MNSLMQADKLIHQRRHEEHNAALAYIDAENAQERAQCELDYRIAKVQTDAAVRRHDMIRSVSDGVPA